MALFGDQKGKDRSIDRLVRASMGSRMNVSCTVLGIRNIPMGDISRHAQGNV